jgi:hypothetical protein
MADNRAKSKELIASYLGKRVTAKLDGGLFDHVPATFLFRFQEPDELADELAMNYGDELEALDCLDDDGEWASDELIPVAGVSKLEDDDDEDGDDDPYEFAWVFLDWRKQPKEPKVLVMTTDDWGLDRPVANLAALRLQVG